MMKKTLLLLVLMAASKASFGQQLCVRDSSVLQTGALLAPPFWDTITMLYALNDACITHPYNQSVTVNVPTSFQNIPMTNVTIATTGAVSNLPVGLTYSCDPPNCVFNAGTLGCIRIYGTPTSANVAPDTFDLGITVTINLLLGSVPLVFPGQLPGNNHYYLALKDAQCLVGAYDQHVDLAYIKTSPNPFSGETTISVETIEGGDYNFEVFNVVGQNVHTRAIRLEAGQNQIRFDGNDLPNGSYFYTIGNKNGKIARQIVVAH
ncbi:MAG: T9SS type A sorting domain-containing protein [Saprospiraceae bacterium]|nr:T9SS type A sorting domain-containing protein [Saprospiraceae bacterium]